MPKKIRYTAKVRRTVIDTVSLVVTAEDTQEGYQLAREVLKVFPDVHGVDGVNYCYIENRENISSTLLEIKKERN